MKLVHMDTLRAPDQYSKRQIEYALRLAYWLGRGKFLLLAEPDETRE